MNYFDLSGWLGVSEAIEERNRTIGGLEEKLSTSEERLKVLGAQNKNLQDDLMESSSLSADKVSCCKS